MAGRDIAGRLVACLVERREKTLPATLKAAAETVTALFEASGAHGGGTLAERLARGWRTSATEDVKAALVLCADHELEREPFTARVVAATDAPLTTRCSPPSARLRGAGTAVRAWRWSTPGRDRPSGALCAPAGDGSHARTTARILEHASGLPIWRSAGEGTPAPTRSAGTRCCGEGDRLRRETGRHTDDELALAALARVHRLPRDAPFGVFALGRSVGWVAHTLEASAAGTLNSARAPATSALGR